MQSSGPGVLRPRFLLALIGLALTAPLFDGVASAAITGGELSSSAVKAQLKMGRPFVASRVVLRGNLDLRQLEIAGPFRCRKCRIAGSVLATDATFRRTVDLSGTTIAGQASFEGATFLGPAIFGRGPGKGSFATFGQGADFAFVTFAELASFQNVQFRGGADFSLTRFRGDAAFSGAAFAQPVYFDSAQVSGRARFDAGAAFDRRASFRLAAFDGPTDFSQARFAELVVFDESQFAEGARFLGAAFKAGCSGRAGSFKHVLATKTLDFSGAEFAAAATFDGLSAEGLNFENTQFSPGGTSGRTCSPKRGVALRGASVRDLVMNVDAAVADVTDEPRTALKWVEASAKDRGDLGLANDAHYRLRVLESDGYSWPWHALDLVFYRWVAGYLVRPLRPLFTLLALVLLVFVMRSAWRNLRGGASNRGGRSERAGHRSVGHTIARGGNELLDTFTAVWSRKMDQQASEWALFGRRVEALVYRLLIVCALLGLANSNPTLRQMLDALL